MLGICATFVSAVCPLYVCNSVKYKSFLKKIYVCSLCLSTGLVGLPVCFTVHLFHLGCSVWELFFDVLDHRSGWLCCVSGSRRITLDPVLIQAVLCWQQSQAFVFKGLLTEANPTITLRWHTKCRYQSTWRWWQEEEGTVWGILPCADF